MFFGIGATMRTLCQLQCPQYVCWIFIRNMQTNFYAKLPNILCVKTITNVHKDQEEVLPSIIKLRIYKYVPSVGSVVLCNHNDDKKEPGRPTKIHIFYTTQDYAKKRVNWQDNLQKSLPTY